MGCLVVLFALISPRLALFVVYGALVDWGLFVHIWMQQVGNRLREMEAAAGATIGFLAGASGLRPRARVAESGH